MKRLVVCFMFLLGAFGCAHYSTTAGLVGGIRTVAIPTADNQTPEVDVAQRLTERAVDAFLADSRLRVVDEESADALLLLQVNQLEDEPFTYTAGEVTEQYRYRLFVEVTLHRTGGDVLLEMGQLAGFGTYDAALPDEDDQGREPAIDAAMDMVIEEIVDRTTASW
ncbi:MAG: LPS assembly lipoprotein LptE [Candidatus Latescibacterota bacterium]|nr:LPS assembly lipoprotein LptE [Candidatus Latescibacterota bacterium]